MTTTRERAYRLGKQHERTAGQQPAAQQCDELAAFHSITSSASMEVEAMFVLRRPGAK
jgi:hypothetical protein